MTTKERLSRREEKRDWTAVRRGSIYCAPACGFSCTWAAYQKATRDANACAKKLGAGWKTRVWENLGWYWEVFDATKSIHVYGSHAKPDQYSVIILGQYVAHGETAVSAIRAAIDETLPSIERAAQLIVSIDAFRPTALLEFGAAVTKYQKIAKKRR